VSDRNPLDLGLAGEVTRRKLLKGAGAGMLVVGGGGLLAACGSGGSGTSAATGTTAAAEGQPVPGGVLRVGAQGGSNTDTLDAHNVLSNTDFARTAQLYDPLVRLNTKGQPEKVLAESVEPNKTATQWTIKLKKGVKFHDGSPCNAKAVLFTFNRIVSGEFPGSNVLGPLDLKKSKASDELTLVLEYSTPYAILYEALAGRYEYLYIVPPGYNPKKPIGTGPFKLKTFTPGRESITVKFDEYWDSPKPYLDEIHTININEETAQVSALQSGQVDCIDYLTAASISTLESGGFAVSIAETGGWAPITMRCDKAPFSDNRVREAMKLVIDRPTMLKSVFADNGNIANDHFGRYTPAVESLQLPQHEQDLEKAASLLKQAGQSGTKFQLYTSEVSPGMSQTAQVFATQAQSGGINVEAIKQPVTEYFARSYLKVPFAMDYWAYEPYLVTAGQATITGAVFSVTKFSSPTYDKYYEEATSTLDENLRTELIQKMVKIDWAEGGNIIPMNFPVIDSWAQNVHGITPSVLGQALSNFQFQNFWMT
jgi:peptide/nickel transport system substrate-binding protein